MTHVNDRNSGRINSGPNSGEEILDDFLNTSLSSGEAPDADERFAEHEPDSLSTSAGAFHRRLDAAQEHYSHASHPDPDFWDRILSEHVHREREPDMSSVPLEFDKHPTRIQPVPEALSDGRLGMRLFLSAAKNSQPA